MVRLPASSPTGSSHGLWSSPLQGLLPPAPGYEDKEKPRPQESTREEDKKTKPVREADDADFDHRRRIALYQEAGGRELRLRAKLRIFWFPQFSKEGLYYTRWKVTLILTRTMGQSPCA